MTSYRVRWEIDLDADSPEDAARQALAIQRGGVDDDCAANVFDVCVSGTAEFQTIDLQEVDGYL